MVENIHGSICWVARGVKAPGSLVQFYENVFGWKSSGSSSEGWVPFQWKSKLVASFVSSARIRDLWTPFFVSEDMDLSVELILQEGGKKLQEIVIPQVCDISLFQDPLGAQFGIWRSLGVNGFQLHDVPNSFVWSEIVTPDLQASASFYSKLFGWKLVGNEFTLRDEPIVGIQEVPQRVDVDSAAWSIFFGVEDGQKAIEVSAAEGGKLLSHSSSSQGELFAVIEDAKAAPFSIVQAPQIT